MNHLVDLIKLLARHNVEFVVVGGYAAAAYGSALVLTPDNCTKLKNIYLDTDIGPLDCLGSVLGVGGFPVF